MVKDVKVLQIGDADWRHDGIISGLKWEFVKASDIITTLKRQDEAEANYRRQVAFIKKAMSPEKQREMLARLKAPKDIFDVNVVIFSSLLAYQVYAEISKKITAYTLILDNKLSRASGYHDQIATEKRPFYFNFEDKIGVQKEIRENFFTKPGGGAFHVHDIKLANWYQGEATYVGNSWLKIRGNFGASFRQLATWQYNLGIYGRSEKLWLEYEKTEGITLELVLTGLKRGNNKVIKRQVIEEEQLRDNITFDYDDNELGFVAIGLNVKGKGKLKIGSLHYRESRHDYGEFIPGGQKIYDKTGEELFYYFNPGDLKPPLCVYFSGYKTLEGFEGYFMMKNMKTPFLLISDPRIEGGNFYLGSESLEKQLVSVINKARQSLKFSQDDVVLSGLSMGTFGALYYAPLLNPHAVIIGKPLTSLGDIAANETIKRPGGFPTSLDIVNTFSGGTNQAALSKINARFWDRFNAIDNESQTKYIIAYMKNDDYDGLAYERLLLSLSESQTILNSKGIPGRHNDATNEIVTWFQAQYQRILKEDFDR